jgi:hypothetical protein
MDMLDKHPWILAIVVVLAVGYLVLKRFSGEPLNARDLVSAPLILTALGAYDVYKAHDLAATDYLWLAAGVVVGVGCGAARGATIKLFTKDGVLWQRYTVRTVVVWVVSLAISGGFGLLAHVGGMNEHARPMMLSIGLGMLGEMAALGLRALSTGHPFSPERKSSRAARSNLRENLNAAAMRVNQRRATPPAAELRQSPSLADGVSWLSMVVRETRPTDRRD